MLSDYHVHSNFSFDSEESPDNIVSRAIELGMPCIAITDHQDFNWPVEGEFPYIDFDNYFSTLDELSSKYEDKIKDLCSFAFLRCYKNGNPILELDKDEFISDYPTCRVKENRPGDMAEVYVADKLRKFKFPEIKDERFMSEDVVWISMGIKYKTVYINKAIYQGEYLAGGLTANDKP